MCFNTSHTCASLAGGWELSGEYELVLASVNMLSETDVYSAALHQCQRGLHFEEQLYYHYQLIN